MPAAFGRRGTLLLRRAGPRGRQPLPEQRRRVRHAAATAANAAADNELWPAAGVAGAGAAAAANESKAADGDMDCDSDSDLGSRISLHAPM